MSTRFQEGPYPGAPRPASPPSYLPQGTGLEPGNFAPQEFGPPPHLTDAGMRDAAWRRLWNRLPGGPDTKNLALYGLHRSNVRDPDAVVSRWAISTADVTAGPGVTNFAFVFDTLTVFYGVNVYMDFSAGSALDFRSVLRAGSDGAYVWGSDQNPASLSALKACFVGLAPTNPMPMSPMVGKPNNDWQGQVLGVAGVAITKMAINIYGLSLWTPNGQIQ